MRASLKQISLAAVMALTVAGTALVTAGAASAQHWHGHGGGGFGPGFAAGAMMGGGPYYGGGYYGGPYAYGGDCYIQRQAFINRFGHRVIRRVRVCD